MLSDFSAKNSDTEYRGGGAVVGDTALLSRFLSNTVSRSVILENTVYRFFASYPQIPFTYTFFFIRTLKIEVGLMFLAYQGFRALKCS